MSFSFLERTVKILVVDDEPALTQLYLEHLNAYPLYDAISAWSAKEADRILSSTGSCHVCLLDLCMNDIDNDEFFLMKKYSQKTSFIIVSARDSLEKGFEARKYGAFAIIKKPVDFYSLDFFNIVNEAFLRSIVIPENMDVCKPLIKPVTDALIFYRPDSVREWAEKSGVNERHLRRIWADCHNGRLKYILWFTKVFYFASLYYNNYYRKKFRIHSGPDDTRIEPVVDSTEQFRQFYSLHKKEIGCFLSGVRVL